MARRFDATWSNTDREEHDALVSEVLSTHETNRDRADAYQAGVEGAVQAHRYWARDIERKVREDGYLRFWKTVTRRGTVEVVSRGRSVRKPRTWSVARVAEQAVLTTQDLTIEVFTREDIETKRHAALKMRKSYDDELQMWDMMLAFLDMAEADDIATAEATNGLSLESFLASERSVA